MTTGVQTHNCNERIYNLCRDNRVADAVGLVVRQIDEWLSGGEVAIVARALAEIEVDLISPEVAVSLLQSTFCLKDALPSRTDYVLRVAERLIRVSGHERVDRILSRLG